MFDVLEREILKGDKYGVNLTVASAEAAKYGMIQIYNPVESGKRLLVKKLFIGAYNGDISCKLGFYDTQLASGGTRVLSDRSESKAEIRTAKLSSSVGANDIITYWRTKTANLETHEINSILEEGQGICFESLNVNVEVYAGFSWKEI